MVNRTLFSVALLIAAGTVALPGCTTNAETLTPIALTNAIQDEISGSRWDGDWYGDGAGGDAGLYLVIGYGHAEAHFSIQSDAAGDYTYRALGTVKGNTMELERKGRSTMSLSLSTEREASLF